MLSQQIGLGKLEAFFLNRDEAVKLLKELNLACDRLGEEGIMLMPPDADDVRSHGYQLHIKTKIGGEKMACIKPIADQYKLAIANEPDKNLIIVYRPMASQTTVKR